MANTLKTLQGELLVSEVESIQLDIGMAQAARAPMALTNVTVVSKSGTKYSLANNLQGVIAMKIYAAALNFVAGDGHNVFDPAKVQVK